ncbi:MAG: UDP-N-acetylmuramate dehydrogenase [Halioglobus sp.]|nr:UDP-N-acetylmuramate dehydrogenase [Halioglobus sp.]
MQILPAESLRPYNSLSLEASAAALALVDTDQELSKALDWSRAQGLAVLPLGQGSNVVIVDDLEALVVRQQGTGFKVLGESDHEVSLRVSAGQDWHSLVEKTLGQGLYGLENLALIPGTVGAAPIQNIGAYGVELDRFVRAVQAVDIETGEHLVLTRQECAFGYRDSVFKHELRDKIIITAVDLCLSREPVTAVTYPALQAELDDSGIREPTPRDVYCAVVNVRRRRLPDPAEEPNAGSFFKNPVIEQRQAEALSREFGSMPVFVQQDNRVKVPAAWLIDQIGWKGHRQNGVGVHPGHALVLVNYGGDSGKALLQLAADISASVSERFDINLEIEPRVYGLPQ